MTEFTHQYTPQQQERILKIARNTLVEYLSGRDPLDPKVDPHLEKFLIVPRGCFVTLHHRHGRLRGCIGSFVQSEPFWVTLMRNTVASAQDPRIVRTNPVTLAEINDLIIDISVLTPMVQIDDPTAMRIGIDGVCIRTTINGQRRSGVFLPEVAVHENWTVEQTLSYCCAHKMGIPEDAWKTRDDLEFFFFQSIKVCEKPIDEMR